MDVAGLVREPLVRALDERIAGVIGDRTLSPIDERFASATADRLRHVGLLTNRATLDELARSSDEIVRFAERWLARDHDPLLAAHVESNADGYFSEGVSLFYLCYVHVAATGTRETVREYVARFAIGDEHPDVVAADIERVCSGRV